MDDSCNAIIVKSYFVTHLNVARARLSCVQIAQELADFFLTIRISVHIQQASCSHILSSDPDHLRRTWLAFDGNLNCILYNLRHHRDPKCL